MSSTHCNFWIKKFVYVSRTKADIYLKRTKLKDIEKLHILRGIGYLLFVQIEPLVLQQNLSMQPKVQKTRHIYSFYFSSFNKAAEIIFETRTDKKLKVS